MRKTFLTFIVIVLSAASFVPAPPAQAVGTMGAALLGSGQVSPGLTVWPNSHQWGAYLYGPAAGVVGLSVPADLYCTVWWNTVQVEAIGGGAGAGQYNCTARVSNWAGPVTVARTGAVVAMTFGPPMAGEATCVLSPAQLPPNPVFHYSIACGGVVVDLRV